MLRYDLDMDRIKQVVAEHLNSLAVETPVAASKPQNKSKE